MEATIKLTKFVSDDQARTISEHQAWPISILAEGINMDAHIFVYHVGKEDDPIPGDRFECVASVNQMFEIPKNQGMSLTTATGIPYYRSNVLEYVARTAAEAEEIYVKVVEEVQVLLKNWNASLRMRATEFALITGDLTQTSDVGMNPPLRVSLSYHPAGTSGTVEGKPAIISADPNQVGWLPVTFLGLGAVVPPGAKFYYNINRDASLRAAWPPIDPLSGNQLHRNGILMPYGQVWVLTTTTVWWLDFDPATIPGYRRVGANEDWGAPWPRDYVNRANPGAIGNNITLTIFK